MSDLSFASDFPRPTRDQWLKLVDGVLKGAPFDRALVSATADGLAIAPLYPRAEGRSPVIGRATGRPWQVLARIDHPSAAAANAQALTDLRNGATGLHVVFAGSVGANGFGLADGSPETVAALFADVVLEAGIRIELDLSMDCKGAAEALMALVAASGVDPAETDIAFGYDPLGQMALHGGAPLDWPALAPQFGRLAATILQRGFRGSVCSADGRIVHAAGGSEAQELAFAVASALACWRAMEAAGIDADAGRRAIGFRLAADADQFLTVAKTRALRRLWAHVEASAGLSPAPIRLHAETAWRMTTRRDPWVNLLRATVAVFSAGIGGADAVSVTPFTQALGLPDAFARRLARNTQLVLLEESNLARVADPAAGSGGIEALTDELAGAAWALVQETEAKGGLDRALADGSFQGRVAAVRTERARALARRRQALTGTSEFPNIAEAPVAVEAPLVAVPRRIFGTFEPLAPMRLAEPYEALRDAADAAPTRPVVFLATLGPVADFTARATFARNLFEAGGLSAPVPEGFVAGDATDIPALAAAFAASGATVACLCSSDARYAAEAEAAAQALKAAGCKRLWLAGRPAATEPALRAAGVDGFAYAGCDVLATLSEVHVTLGLE
jgi:methylmalonyl-CoA mutase